MDLKILGSGSHGIVCYPSIDNEIDMVSKVANFAELQKELKALMLLPKNGPYKLPDSPEIKIVPNEILEFI